MKLPYYVWWFFLKNKDDTFLWLSAVNISLLDDEPLILALDDEIIAKEDKELVEITKSI